MMMVNGLEDIVFVGGAPRSGTTMLHALICTSPSTNDYVAECSYLTSMLLPYFQGLETWEVHTKHYFSDHNEFLKHHFAHIQDIIEMIHNRLGRPRRLALKDPMLTRYFHRIPQILPEARFVVIFRDPRDTILSRLNVARRLHKGTEPSKDVIEALCSEYNTMYHGIITQFKTFDNRLLVVDYNDIASERNLSQLEAFGLSGIESVKIWFRGQEKASAESSDPWSTDLYGAALSTRSINRHETELDPIVADYIMGQCGWVGKAFGFKGVE